VSRLMSLLQIPPWVCVFLVAACMGVRPSCAKEEPTKEQIDFFEGKIRPVLVRECYSCHSAVASAEGKLRGGLMLDSNAASRRGGDTGPAVVPGDLQKSLLLKAIKHEDFEMPPRGSSTQQ
jgi:hypothetical protein